MLKEDKTIENQDFEVNRTKEGSFESDEENDNVADESFEASDNMSDDLPEQYCEWQDKYIRLSADFDNYRKRTLKEKMDLISAGSEDILKTVISIIDDFERAIAAMEKRDDIPSEIEGIRLIYNKFLDVLRTREVVPIEALGKSFDVDFHDAIAKVPAADEASKGVVVDVVQRGYMLKDKILRYCKVVVGE